MGERNSDTEVKTDRKRELERGREGDRKRDRVSKRKPDRVRKGAIKRERERERLFGWELTQVSEAIGTSERYRRLPPEGCLLYLQ